MEISAHPRCLSLAGALLALAGCSGTAGQQSAMRLECEFNGRITVVSHPWTCLRDGGRVIEAPSGPSAWISEAVRVGWQGRGEIKSGRAHYSRFGASGELRLDLPEAGDLCEGPYRLDYGHDADWSATCESGQKIEARVFLNEGGISISAVGKDGEGRTFGFFPQPGEG
jgi:hypothetical protein